MCVSVGGASSSAKSVSSGVPQVSVLGPVLFLVCINYFLTDDLVCKQDAFANDYELYLHYSRVVGQESMAILQGDLDRLVAIAICEFMESVHHQAIYSSLFGLGHLEQWFPI